MFSKIIRCSISMIMVLGFLLISNPAKAQLDEIDAFFEATVNDIETLTKAYVEPLATSIGTTSNSGWITKAAPTKTLGFSVQLRTAFASVPSNRHSFDANDLDLEGSYTITGSSSSTISGDNSIGQTLTNLIGSKINMPPGIGSRFMPLAMVQGNVGLIQGTDLTLRFVPETPVFDYGDISLFGVGIKHGINQWIPGGKLLPVDLSLMAAYNTVDLTADLSGNQKIETITDSFVINALVGKTFPFLSAYAGVGYQTGDFELNFLGNYNIDGKNLTDPISFTDKSDANSHILGGVQFKIAVFRIYAEATIAEFVTYNAGIGFGFRN